MSVFKQYRRKELAELRPYEPGESIVHISISQEDCVNGSPKEGDMIARNPKNHKDQWLVAKEYFETNFETSAISNEETYKPLVDPIGKHT